VYYRIRPLLLINILRSFHSRASALNAAAAAAASSGEDEDDADGGRHRGHPDVHPSASWMSTACGMSMAMSMTDEWNQGRNWRDVYQRRQQQPPLRLRCFHVTVKPNSSSLSVVIGDDDVVECKASVIGNE
jgi:hypothetical protein